MLEKLLDWKRYKSFLPAGSALCILVACRWLKWETERAFCAFELLLIAQTISSGVGYEWIEKVSRYLGVKKQLDSKGNAFFLWAIVVLGVLCSLASSIFTEIIQLIIVCCVYKLLDTGIKGIPTVSPDDVAEKIKRERIKSGSWQQDVHVFDSFEESYFIVQGCLKYSDESFIVKYANNSGGKMLRNFNDSLSDFAEQLFDSENSEKTLLEIIKVLFGKEVPSGFYTKACLKFIKKGKERSKKEEENLENSPIKIKKALAFKTYKTRITKLNWGEILIIISEKSSTSSLEIEKSFRNTIICTLSHELRNLLTGVIGNLELFGENIALQGKEKLTHKIATSSTYVLANRLNDLFDYLEFRFFFMSTIKIYI